MQWFAVRANGVMYAAEDWSSLLDHDDVTLPGRLRAFGYRDAAGHQTIVELAERETLRLVVRHTVAVGPHAVAPSTTIFGIDREDGSGVYLFLHADGNLTLSSDFNAY